MDAQFNLNVTYRGAIAKAKALNITVDYGKLAETDELFDSFHLTSEARNAIIEMYFQDFAKVFTPSNYSFKQRLGLAFHFLFRSKI